MNILITLSQLEVTGAEVYGVTLANELIKRGNKVFVASDTLTKKTKAEYIQIEFNKRRKISDRIKQVLQLVKLIKKNDIQVVHANSRASSWSCNIACILTGIPMICTVHGRQPVHFSRKLIKGFGDYILPVCENIREHIISDLGVKKEVCEVIRNPIDVDKYSFSQYPLEKEQDHHLEKTLPTVSIIGRLSGPKGDVAFELLKELCKLNTKINIQVIGGKVVPKRFKQFKEQVNFLGYIDDVHEVIKKSTVVIGAGRVAVEGILSGRAVIAVGEAQMFGLVREGNVALALASNFGDISPNEIGEFKYKELNKMVMEAINLYSLESSTGELKKLSEIMSKEYSKDKIVEKIEKLYQRVYVKKKHWEIPVVMYHRVINGDEAEKGVHGTFIPKVEFEKHLKYLQDNNFETVTFKDLANGKYRERFNRGKKPIVLTFDDGYEDNYKIAYPLLKKYNAKGVIFIMGDERYNRWDVENKKNPEKRFELMTDEMIQEMNQSGIIQFGAHTMTHPRLTTLTDDEIRMEVEKSHEIIQKKLGEKTNVFAYPYGDLDERVKGVLGEFDFEFCVATDSGPVTFSDDMREIRRIAIFSTNSLFNFKRKVTGKYNFIRIEREGKL